MKTHSTNYFNTLITIAEDSKVIKAIIPPIKGNKKSIANYQFELINKNLVSKTSDDVIFETFAIRNDLPAEGFEQERKQFFSKGQPCLRTSPLAKIYGWGILSNEDGNLKLIDASSQEYQDLLNNDSIKKVPAMKSKR